jgi:hypothetical protein
MATLKSKQTSIANVQKHLLTVVSLPIPLIFHWSLPLIKGFIELFPNDSYSSNKSHTYCLQFIPYLLTIIKLMHSLFISQHCADLEAEVQ